MLFADSDYSLGAVLAGLALALTTVGTAILSLVNTRDKMRHDKKIDELDRKAAVAEAEAADCKEKHTTLTESFQKLEKSIQYDKRIQALPIPSWIKDHTGKWVWVSESAQRDVLIPMGLRKEDALGKNDKDIFGDVVAKKFAELDRQAMKKKGYPALGTFELHSTIGDVTIMKYCVQSIMKSDEIEFFGFVTPADMCAVVDKTHDVI